MAIAKMSTPLASAQGKRGGIVYRRDSAGQHIQRYPSLTRSKCSEKQRAIRNAYGRALYAFSKTLTEQQRAQWGIYANIHLVKSKQGNWSRLSAMSAFLSVNIPRLRHGLPVQESPPF